MSETKISKQILDYLNKAQIFNFRILIGKIRKGKGAIYGAPVGTPDRFALLKNGTSLFIEVKQPGEKPKPDQIKRHEEIRKSGGRVIVADSFDSFLAQLKEIKEVI